jgi:predicted nucleic acid-binding protein
VNPAFWDTSALVPLCVRQQPSAAVSRLLKQYQIVVWWATSVEMRSAFERLLRMGQMTAPEHAAAGLRLNRLRRSWREMQPSEALRAQAETFLGSYPLNAADSLQLAAAWIWCAGAPQSCILVSGDTQLLEAATQLGFQAVAA